MATKATKTSKKTLETTSKATKASAKAKTPKTKAKKTKPVDLRLVAQVTAPDGTIFQKMFSGDTFPVSCVFVKMNAPKTPYHKTWHVLCFTSKETKARADENRVKRMYIDKANPAFDSPRYLDVARTEQIVQVDKLDKPEDRSAFKAAKIARGDLAPRAKKEEKKEAKSA